MYIYDYKTLTLTCCGKLVNPLHVSLFLPFTFSRLEIQMDVNAHELLSACAASLLSFIFVNTSWCDNSL